MTRIFLILSIYFLVVVPSFGQPRKINVTEPVLIDSSIFLYDAGDIFLAGQPTKEILENLSKQGITLVINIRTKAEMAEHTKTAYDEEAFIEELNLDYLLVEVGGNVGYKPQVIDAIAQKINASEGKILLHCAAAGRATLVWMAYLVQYHKYTIDDAMLLGKKARFSFPLQDLLGYDITIRKAGKKDK